MEPIERRIQSYIDDFTELGFRSFNPFEQRRVEFLLEFVALILGFPLFVLGMLMNFVPYLMPDILFKKLFMPKLRGERTQGQAQSNTSSKIT